ncbi:branched-chain amino acid transaminase [Hyphobacterium sp. HN65]|uniref:Branched-chain-amino-acid aminotransferase n=1 Tax=Hyphobacterium lacteum TaxID=3116575 RepID=A0ABU7LSC9_9PROT|nr:branched-chain amino acid transaminase [Hyphobacterium sp. HN65]MEE2526244.1 branched-chain amino acid transaminase [Hyphobacterium sp. HN65]
MKKADYIWMDGELRRWEDCTVHVMSHALHYGSSVFEGIRAYDTPDGPAIFRLEDHIKRLYRSARMYRIEIPYDFETVCAACIEAVRENKLTSGYIRPLAFRGAGSVGVTARDTPIHLMIAAFPWGTYLGEDALKNGVDVAVSSWNRLAPNTIPPGMKAGGNYLSSMLIGYEAKDRGVAEGIGLGRDGLLSEGSGENLFLIEDGVIRTPPGAASILKGITRDTVIKLLADMGHDVQEQPLPREALYTADEIFFTGTAAEVTPVKKVDGLDVGNGDYPVTRSVQDAFFGLFSGQTKDTRGWLRHVQE